MTTTPLNELSYTTGTANSTTITFNAGSHEFVISKNYVTLSHDYVRSPPAGYPNAVAGATPAINFTAFPQTILSGTRARFYQPEAAALVAAGAGVISG